MAKYFGGTSRYLFWNAFKNDGLSVLLFLIGSALLYIAVKYLSHYPYLYIFVMLLFVLPFMKILEKSSLAYKRKYRKFDQGMTGEEDVYRELRKLSDDYTVYQDLHLPGQNQNIDFAVVGPTGVYAIEVKNLHPGHIGFNGIEFTNNGQTQNGMLSEVRRELFGLHEYLSTAVHQDIFIHPILVFTNHGNTMNFGMKPVVSNIQVIRIEWLLKAVQERPSYDYLGKKEQIIQVFNNLVSTKH